MQEKSFLTFISATMSHVRHQKHRRQKRKQTRSSPAACDAPAQRRAQPANGEDTQLILQTTSGDLTLRFRAREALASAEGLGRSQLLGAAQGAQSHHAPQQRSGESAAVGRSEKRGPACVTRVCPARSWHPVRQHS